VQEFISLPKSGVIIATRPKHENRTKPIAMTFEDWIGKINSVYMDYLVYDITDKEFQKVQKSIKNILLDFASAPEGNIK
jgi:hypothetical protein